MGRTSSKRRAVLQIRQFPDLMVVVAGNSSTNFAGYGEVEWVDGYDGGASAVRALGGGALNVALLMPEGERANWECLSLQLPGRLAVFWRQFENATCQPGMDPATFATELRGFGDMGKHARDWMIRDRFIAA